jgi:hypothetical protein
MAAAIQFAEGGDGGLAVGNPISVNETTLPRRASS